MMPAGLCSLGHVRVGASQEHVDYVLPFAYSERYQRRSGIQVSVTVGPHELIVPAAARGKLDFVIAEAAVIEHGRLEHEILYDGCVFVVAGLDHPLAERGELTLADLVGYEWVVPAGATERQLHRIFEKRALPAPEVRLRASSSLLRDGALQQSSFLGVHCVPTFLLRAEPSRHLALLDVKDLVWKSRVLAAYKSAASLSRAARGLLEHLKVLAIATADHEARAPDVLEHCR